MKRKSTYKSKMQGLPILFKAQCLQNGYMLLDSPDSSGNPFWAGVQRKKIATDSGTMLPNKALSFLLLEKKVIMIVLVYC